MCKVNGRLTVYFEEPFWIGVFEKIDGGCLFAAKVTFGTEPRERELYEWILKHYEELQFSPAVTASAKNDVKNPKRRQREAKKQMQDTGIGTKAQQALKMQQEQNKQERKVKSRQQKLEEAERRFALKQQKKKERHRGH